MRRLLILGTALLTSLLTGMLVSGCACKSEDQTLTRFHEDGRAKPIVAIPAMIDTTAFDAPWSIAEELTTSVIHSIGKNGEIFIHSQDDFAIAENPFGNDLSWVKREFDRQEFAVFFELVEHELIPTTKSRHVAPHETANNLNMGIRIRVMDLRGNHPKIILQELVHNTYYIPKSLFPTDYNVASWGTEEYMKSPMGIAHAQIAQEIASRVSDYILLAKSR